VPRHKKTPAAEASYQLVTWLGRPFRGGRPTTSSPEQISPWSVIRQGRADEPGPLSPHKVTDKIRANYVRVYLQQHADIDARNIQPRSLGELNGEIEILTGSLIRKI
jgi:hypothetical protein